MRPRPVRRTRPRASARARSPCRPSPRRARAATPARARRRPSTGRARPRPDLASRWSRGRLPARLAVATFEADQLEELRDASALLAHGHSVEICEVAQVVERREPVVEAAVAAEDVADPPANLARLVRRIEPEHARRAGGREQQRR